ncbi:MAG: hypothetical protein WBE04_05700, partial [Methyloceanibacter sp.]
MARFNLLAALRGVTVLALLCMALGQAAVAQGAGGEGGSQGGPTDYPLPGTAHEVYSPIGEGFDSP